MFKRTLILFLIFYILILFQTSFLTHFEILGQAPNLVLIFLFLIIFFNLAPLSIHWEAILAGFFLDLFSDYPIGISIFFLFLNTLLLKEILKNFKKTNIFVFTLLFLVFLCLYNCSLSVFDYFFEKSNFFRLDRFFSVQVIYNLVFAIFGFYFVKIALARLKPREMRLYR